MIETPITIAGLKVEVEDLDKNDDGVLSHDEKPKRLIEKPLPPNAGNDALQTLDRLNRDAKDPNSNFSTIDFNTELNERQAVLYAWHDSLVEYGISHTESLALTRAIKRNLVSLNRGGRKEGVAIHNGDRSYNQNTSFFGRLKNAVRGNKDNGLQTNQ